MPFTLCKNTGSERRNFIMARNNYVFLYGRVTKNPKIVVDNDGNYLRGQCLLTTIRGKRNVGSEELEDYKYDCPIIMTRDPNRIHEMAQWKDKDMVEIKGIICTRDIKRISTCANCKHENVKVGVMLYIEPIYLGRVESGLTDEQCTEKLRAKCEISNQCIVAGNLCNDPTSVRDDSDILHTQYQIALNRKFHVKNDPPDMKTDYPWVKSMGENAKLDSLYLRKGSSVLIDGFIQTRQFKQKTVCEECGETYTWTNSVIEIVPYSTEYLLNCNFGEQYVENSSDATTQTENVENIISEKKIEKIRPSA